MTLAARAKSILYNPFPGLRPFYPSEEHIFFGRESQVDAMVDKLARSRFLAVVGTSGSGKSSLVNCGLRPALHRGLMAKAGTSWRIAQFRPGSNPIQALARALAAERVLFKGFEASGLSLEEMVEATLRMSKLGVVDLYEQTQPEGGPNLLLVADQFEELFRFRQMERSGAQPEHAASQEAVAFVNLLLEARSQPAFPIYVVLTMRSDFLGDCAALPGLPEAINEGQYLVPRLTRDERRMAVVGPVGVGGGQISPVLITQLVNDVGDNPDQLSLLQHALNRTWMRWQHEGQGHAEMDPADYLEIGTMSNALDQHADKAYGELTSDRDKQICEKIFEALTDTAMDGRGVRRPTPMSTLCALAGATQEEVTRVIDVFRKSSRSFLMPPITEPLRPDTVIDISHESLMRVWQRLRTWTEREMQSARIYRRLAETAALHAARRAGLARDPELQVALNWRAETKPTSVWTERYGGGFEATMRFLDESETSRAKEWKEAEEHQKREVRRARVLFGAIGLAAILALGSVCLVLWNEKSRQAERTRMAQVLAETNTKAIQESLQLRAQAGEAENRVAALVENLSKATDAAKKEELLEALKSAKASASEAYSAANASSASSAAVAAGGKLLPAEALSISGLFTVAQQVKITRSSGSTNPYNMFGAADRGKGDLDVATFFEDKHEAGHEHWVEWQTRNDVRVQSIQLFAFHDSYQEIGYKYRRAFKKFKLSAKTPAGWTPLVAFTPALPYGQTLFGHTEDSLAICFQVPPTTAHEFRAEFYQAADVLGQYSGPRVVKLDAMAAGCP